MRGAGGENGTGGKIKSEEGVTESKWGEEFEWIHVLTILPVMSCRQREHWFWVTACVYSVAFLLWKPHSKYNFQHLTFPLVSIWAERMAACICFHILFNCTLVEMTNWIQVVSCDLNFSGTSNQTAFEWAISCFACVSCRVLTELVSKMRDMQMDKTELGCLRAIVLFNPGNYQQIKTLSFF